MTDKTEKTFRISLPNPHSSECGSSRERPKPEALMRLTILNEKVEYV
jgi:hypothetical protein